MESELNGDLYFLMSHIESMHLHDVSVRAIVHPVHKSTRWGDLKWCRVERCPMLNVVFPVKSCALTKLKTFWASDLRMAFWIMNKNSYFDGDSFGNLKHLHLRSCPSLQYVLPAKTKLEKDPVRALRHIYTIEIILLYIDTS
jgi:hypothetical protein